MPPPLSGLASMSMLQWKQDDATSCRQHVSLCGKTFNTSLLYVDVRSCRTSGKGLNCGLYERH
eukprot:3987879-Amphidinium_carterae.1